MARLVMVSGVISAEGRRLPTGTVTFLLTDVAGSTRLWESSPVAMARAVARHYEVLDAAIAAHGGARPVEQGEGDSVVAVFVRPSDAAGAALDAQRAFSAERWPEGATLSVRMALHTGEAELRDDGNYFGPTVNRTARLRALAAGGQVLLSGTTADVIADYLPDDVSLVQLGIHRLRDLGRPERVVQLCHPDLSSVFPPLSSMDTVPNNLPTQLTSFVGRESELAEVAAVIGANRMVTLTGAGGCGKTRLGLQAAADVSSRFDDGCWWIDLAPLVEPDAVAVAIATALGIRTPGQDPVAASSGVIGSGAVLLVIDNCEHLLAPAAGVLDRMLRACPSLTVVATSREPLGVPGEVVWRVPSLSTDDGVRLFVERGIAARPNFALSPAGAAAVRRICDRVDGLPLAVELAAARVRGMSVEQIAAGLEDCFRIVAGGSRTVMARQQTLLASIEWSHDLCDPDEKILLRRLSVFAGGFTLDAAEAVAGFEPLGTVSVLDLLLHLVDRSLVQVDDGPGDEARYRLLETVRQFARDRLSTAGEVAVARDRHLAFFLSLAEEMAPQLGYEGHRAALEKFRPEHDNIRAAVEWAADAEDPGTALRLCVAAADFWWHNGRAVDGQLWFERLLSRPLLETPLVARARCELDNLRIQNGDLFAIPDLHATRELAERIGAQDVVARCHFLIGLVQVLVDPEATAATGRACIAAAEAVGDTWSMQRGYEVMAAGAGIRDRAEEVAAIFAEARQHLGGETDAVFDMWDLLWQGSIALRRGRVVEAAEAVAASRATASELSNKLVGWIADTNEGELLMIKGRPAEAADLLAEASARLSREGDFVAQGLLDGHHAKAAALAGDAARARAVINEQRVAEAVAQGIPPWGVCTWLGLSLHDEGQQEEARLMLDQALAIDGAFGSPFVLAHVRHVRSEVALADGDLDRAEDEAYEALAAACSGGFLAVLFETVDVLASIAVARDDAVEAVRLLAAAAAGREQLGLGRAPRWQARADQTLETVRAMLDDGTFAVVWAEGANLDPEAVGAYLMRARGERRRPTTGWASLTATELEVVRAVREGLTNPQIAARLIMSRNTVKTHLSHIFTKLDVATRSELASAATRRQT